VATRKRKKGAAKALAVVPSPAFPGQQLVEMGRSVSLTIKKASAEEIVLTLSDGALVQIRPVVLGVERSRDRFNAVGEPIYQLNLGFALHTKVPKKLKRKVK
jgi:hypothetical protein